MLISKYFYYWALSLHFNEILAGGNNIRKLENSNIQDFPCNKDLRAYLTSLKRIINFAYDYKDELDLNFGFGLFLVNGKP